MPQARYQYFRGGWASWATLFEQAAEFATRIGRERVISISHSEGPGRVGVVTVWYWSD